MLPPPAECASRYRIRACRPWFGNEGFQSAPRTAGIGQVAVEAHRGTVTVPQYNMDELWQMTLLLGQQLAIQGKLEDVLWVWRFL